jgi:hypothetical protein
MKSWKTTTTGILAILASAIGATQVLIAGGTPDWTAVIAAVIAGIGLIAARDNKVTSEQAGAK